MQHNKELFCLLNKENICMRLLGMLWSKTQVLWLAQFSAEGKGSNPLFIVNSVFWLRRQEVNIKLQSTQSIPNEVNKTRMSHSTKCHPSKERQFLFSSTLETKPKSLKLVNSQNSKLSWYKIKGIPLLLKALNIKNCYCNCPCFKPMIGCDNDKCKLSWFHYSCVNILRTPNENTKWFCPDCIKTRTTNKTKT